MLMLQKIRSLSPQSLPPRRAERDLDAEVRSYSAMLEEEKISSGHESQRSPPRRPHGSRRPEQLKEEIRARSQRRMARIALAGPSFRRAHASQKPGLHRRRHSHPRSRHRSEHCNFQRSQRRTPASLPYPSPDRIVSIRGANPITFVNPPNFHFAWEDWADHTQSFDRLSSL